MMTNDDDDAADVRFEEKQIAITPLPFIPSQPPLDHWIAALNKANFHLLHRISCFIGFTSPGFALPIFFSHLVSCFTSYVGGAWPRLTTNPTRKGVSSFSPPNHHTKVFFLYHRCWTIPQLGPPPPPLVSLVSSQIRFLWWVCGWPVTALTQIHPHIILMNPVITELFGLVLRSNVTEIGFESNVNTVISYTARYLIHREVVLYPLSLSPQKKK
ncbi:hypothetical protein BGZ63DRAFT_197954 [Mariannaea sp. PMI_226]|nr:hypothetical protein BGZ63DRAFT_197954 [Mariannaea sp. PMI_226]